MPLLTWAFTHQSCNATHTSCTHAYVEDHVPNTPIMCNSWIRHKCVCAGCFGCRELYVRVETHFRAHGPYPCSFTHVYNCTHRLTHSIVQEGTHSHSQQHAGRHSQPHVHLGIHRHTHGLTQTLEPRATSMSRSMLLHTLSPHDIINTYAHAFQCQPGTHPPHTCTPL